MRVLTSSATGQRILGSLLDAIPSSVIVLDGAAQVVMVNDAFVRFGHDNGWADPRAALGENYLQICLRGDNAQAAQGIQQVLLGSSDGFQMVYPCHSPLEERWFRMSVTPWRAGDEHGAMIIHDNITHAHVAQQVLAVVEQGDLPHQAPIVACDLRPYLAALADALRMRGGAFLQVDEPDNIPVMTQIPAVLHAVAALTRHARNGMRVFATRQGRHVQLHCMGEWRRADRLFLALRLLLVQAGAQFEHDGPGATIRLPRARLHGAGRDAQASMMASADAVSV